MIIYGKNPIFEAAKLELLEQVYIRRGTAVYNTTFNAPVHVLNKNDFDTRFSRDAQGIAAEIPDFNTISLRSAASELKEAKGVVILDRIQDPQNFGAIVRSANCFGIKHIIVPRYHQAPVTSAVCKASAGAIFYTTVIEETNLTHSCEMLKDIGYTIVAFDMDGSDNLNDVKITGKTALIIGSEGMGVKDKLEKNADKLVKIPMSGNVNSLNAAQSAAIALYSFFGE